jgi:hypothetical protein
MSSGGGTTTQVSTTELPSWLQDAAQSNLARADYASQIGYVPQYGLDVAGFTPMQTSAMQNTADAASAFGLSAPTNAMAGMPAQQTNNLGFSGYSSGALYDDYLANLAAQRPAQYEAINSQFVNPITGDIGTAFTPVGSIGDTALSNYTVRDGNIYRGGSANLEDDTIVDDRSDLQKLYDMNKYLSSDKPELSINQALKPFGIAQMLLDPLGRAIAEYNRDYLMENSSQLAPYINTYNDYQSNLGRNSSWDSSLTSGPDISYSSARDHSATTGYNFNMD